MKGQLAFAVAMLFAAPVGAQTAPAKATAAPPSATKPCDPVAPEIGANGDPIYTGCQIRTLGGTLPKLASAPEEPDLTSLYQRGIQGEIIFDIVIGKDGRAHNVTVKVSSRSPELDAIGLDIVNRSVFSPATDRDGKPIDVKAVYPTYFWKDSIGKDEFTNKKCDQFLIDTAWHQNNFPEEKPEQYRGWLLITGLLFANSVQAGKLKKNLDLPTYSQVVETCKNNPGEPFIAAVLGKP